LQDAIKVDQRSSGKFEVPKWDPVSQKKIRDALLMLATAHPPIGVCVCAFCAVFILCEFQRERQFRTRPDYTEPTTW
jgi:hypothetical protein